ncbi:TraB/GumN family protein [Tahibacter amnicola]|uniref:TraB/GumN family protein n=1 Tax=Tahibacter amnicola TaxID=2976241 RepID=A0ABY6B9D7_9GAMM|nr:TraB/GumN family protein [Tahibacter amnicola]UXI66683.1 TraB/GumN family protein [Tahibacter amnicola]
MTTEDPHPEDFGPPDPLLGQPIRRLTLGDTEFTLLGTAHVSRASVAAVEALIEREPFDAVAVELDANRHASLRDPDLLRKMDLFQVIRQGKAGLVAANLALSAFQRRLAEQYGIEPGAELKAAVDRAEARNIPVWLIDRDIGVTLKRAYRSVGFWDRMGIISGLGASVFSTEEIGEQEIEKLKRGDMLESAFSEFARESEPLYRSLIAERDSYMAASLRDENTRTPKRRVLAVVGAGHLAGLEKELQSQTAAPAELRTSLDAVPPGSRWPKWLAAGIFVAIFAAIAYAFSRDASLGVDALRDWVLFTGGLAGLGAMAGGGHPLSVLAAFVAAPLKPFRPGIPPGAASAGVEIFLRKPRVADFDTLRHDVSEWTGWWKNRISRTLLVFLLTNLGSMVGVYLAGFKIFKSLA